MTGQETDQGRIQVKTLGKSQIMGVATTPEMNRVPEISLGIYQLTNHENIPKCWVFRVYKFAKILLGFLLCSFALNSVHNLSLGIIEKILAITIT